MWYMYIQCSFALGKWCYTVHIYIIIHTYITVTAGLKRLELRQLYFVTDQSHSDGISWTATSRLHSSSYNLYIDSDCQPQSAFRQVHVYSKYVLELAHFFSSSLCIVIVKRCCHQPYIRTLHTTLLDSTLSFKIYRRRAGIIVVWRSQPHFQPPFLWRRRPLRNIKWLDGGLGYVRLV